MGHESARTRLESLLETAPRTGLYLPHPESGPDHDLLDILFTLGDHVRTSQWEFHNLDLNDTNNTGIAQPLHDAEESGVRVEGRQFLETVRMVLQVIEGSFYGFDTDAVGPWILITVQDGCCYSIFTERAEVLRLLELRFSRAQKA